MQNLKFDKPIKNSVGKAGNIKYRTVVIDTLDLGERVFNSTDECAKWIKETLGIATSKEGVVRYLKMLARKKVKIIYGEIIYCWIEDLKL